MAVNDGDIVFSIAFDDGKVEQAINKMTSKLKKAENEYDELIKKNNEYVEALEKAQQAAELDISMHGKVSPETKELLNAANLCIDETSAQLDTLMNKISALKKDLLQAKLDPESYAKANNMMKNTAQSGKIAADQAQRLSDNIKDVDSNVSKLQKNKGLSDVAKQASNASTSMGAFGRRIKSLAASAFIFSILYKGFRSLTSYLGSALISNTEFAKSISEIKANLLTAFQPIYDTILPALNNLMQALSTASKYLAVFVNALFGKSVDNSQKAAKTLYDQAKATSALQKETKKAEKALASFDTVNILTFSETSTPSSSAEQLLPDFSQSYKDVSGLGGSVERITKALNALKKISFNNLIQSFDRLATAAAPLSRTIFEGLSWAYYNIFVPLATWTIENLLPAFLDLLSAALGALNVVLEAFQPFGEWLWNNFLSPIAEWTGDAIITGIQALTSVLTGFSEWAKENQSHMDLITSCIVGFLGGIVFYISVKNVPGLIAGMKDTLLNLRSWITSAGFAAGFSAAAFGILVAGIMYLATQWSKMNGVEQVTTILVALAAAATAAAIAIAVFHTAWSVGLAAAAIAGGLALLGLTYVFTGNSESDDAASKAEAEATKFYNSYDFNKPLDIPALARGAVLPPNREFLAVLGDQKHGRNLEAPEDLIRQIVREETQGTEIDVNVNFGGTMGQLVRLLYPEIKKEQRRSSAW